MGWALTIAATYMISHVDLFGRRQAWQSARGGQCRPRPFTKRGLYRFVRHPLMTGFILVFWVTPVMTAGHLLFAAAATSYNVAGIWFESRPDNRTPAHSGSER